MESGKSSFLEPFASLNEGEFIKRRISVFMGVFFLKVANLTLLNNAMGVIQVKIPRNLLSPPAERGC